MQRKKPWLAASLSLLLPGAGQYYNNEAIKSLVISGSFILLYLLGIFSSGLTKLSLFIAVFIVWTSAVTDAYQTAKHSGKPLEWYYNPAYVVSMLVLVGPLALPLLWKSSRFSKTAKIIWTSVVTAALLAVFFIPPLLSWLIHQSPGLEELLRQSGIAI